MQDSHAATFLLLLLLLGPSLTADARIHPPYRDRTAQQKQAPSCNLLPRSSGLVLQTGGRCICRSPKAQISYSDRFIPTRSATARLNFSVLDRDAAAEEAAAQP